MCTSESDLSAFKSKEKFIPGYLGEFDSFRRQDGTVARNFHRENLWRISQSMVKEIPENVVLILDGLDERDHDSMSFLQAKPEGSNSISDKHKATLKEVLLNLADGKSPWISLAVNELNKEVIGSSGNVSTQLP
ncbi:hypothetical protein BPOR_0788g00010 [Botrytis porri]|uniref:Uncharacterized protein n=1 Tax=Botrytis porri TaxID=87229 RepID=A0A4Z1K955_9HELO|nr:hypothetical protein BPOR_0788g00010 [Botrytis porri]